MFGNNERSGGLFPQDGGLQEPVGVEGSVAAVVPAAVPVLRVGLHGIDGGLADAEFG